MKLRLIDLRDDRVDRQMYVCTRKGRLASPVARFVAFLLDRPVRP